MTIQEKIQKKAEGFGKLAPVFLEGANFALENQWISVKDDLPYNHPELITCESSIYSEVTIPVIAVIHNFIIMSDAPARLNTSRLHTAGFRIHPNSVL